MNKTRPNSGSILLISLFFMSILAATGAITFAILQNRYRQVHQTATWQEALLASEAGIDIAVNEMRKELLTPETAWLGWSSAPEGETPPESESGTVYYTSQVLLREGEGGQRSFSRIAVDAPDFLRDASGEQWYRVRSTGVAEIPGGALVAGDKEDLALRKFSLHFNRRATRQEDVQLARPQATRLIEAIVKPVGAFRVAMLGAKAVSMNNQNIVIDSYDSRDSNKSTNGFYDPDKRQENGNVSTNGTLIDAGNAHIYGSAATNGGTVLDAANVTGEIRDDFYQDLFAVTRPNVSPDPYSLGNVSGTAVIDASAGEPSQTVLSTIKLSGTQTLRIRGSESGEPTYAQIIVNGDITMTGQAAIIVDPGVYVRIFVAGDADFAGQGILNPNSPLHMQLYGLDRPTNADGSPQTPGEMKIAGNGGFRGTVYAPSYDLTMVGGGTEDSIYGSFVGWTVNMTGVQAVHYDEALGDAGLISDYKVVSWFEDVR
jgi:hypothetical protein